MSEHTAYASADTLRDGRRILIRALRPDDREAMLAAVGRMSEQSRYFRFFGSKSGFTEDEIAYYMDVDFVGHVALVAILEEAGQPQIVGGARYIVIQPGRAEIALGVDDAHQGLGIASILVRHLIGIARAAGIDELEAEVMPTNKAMLHVFRRLGPAVRTTSGQDGIHVSIKCT